MYVYNYIYSKWFCLSLCSIACWPYMSVHFVPFIQSSGTPGCVLPRPLSCTVPSMRRAQKHGGTCTASAQPVCPFWGWPRGSGGRPNAALLAGAWGCQVWCKIGDIFHYISIKYISLAQAHCGYLCQRSYSRMREALSDQQCVPAPFFNCWPTGSVDEAVAAYQHHITRETGLAVADGTAYLGMSHLIHSIHWPTFHLQFFSWVMSNFRVLLHFPLGFSHLFDCA